MKALDPAQNLKLKATIPYLRKLYTSLFASLMGLSLSLTILSAYLKTFEDNEIEFQNFAEKAFLFILLPLVIIGMAYLVFNYFDNLDLFNKRDYLAKREEGKVPRALISEYPYLLGFAVEMLFAAPIFTRSYYMTLTFFLPSANVALARLLAVLTMAAMRLFQLWDLRDKWETEIENPLFVEKSMFKRNRDPDKFKPRQLFWQPLGYYIIFSLAASFFCYFGFPLLMVVFMIVISPNMWWALFSTPIIIILVILGVRLLYNTRKRAILMRKLNQMKTEKIAEVRIKGSRYLSATFPRIPLSVHITDAEGKQYNCIVLTSGKINAPMFFKPDEYMVEHGFHLRGGALMSKAPSYGGAVAVDIGKMGGKENPTNLVFGFRMAHKLRFPDVEGKRIVILNPTPTTAYALEGRECRSIDTGEDMKNYTIYTATGLFNHMERQSRKGKNRIYD